MTGIPIFNVNNNCSTGATALYLAKEAVESGKSDCVLALGFEKMERGSLTSKVTIKLTWLDKEAVKTKTWKFNSRYTTFCSQLPKFSVT